MKETTAPRLVIKWNDDIKDDDVLVKYSFETGGLLNDTLHGQEIEVPRRSVIRFENLKPNVTYSFTIVDENTQGE